MLNFTRFSCASLCMSTWRYSSDLSAHACLAVARYGIELGALPGA